MGAGTNPVIISEITDLSDQGRDLATFTCQAVGDPAPSITWALNHSITVSNASSKYMITSRSVNTTTVESTLTVYNITSSDVGIYTCMATNVNGNDMSNNGMWYVYNEHCIVGVYI